MEALRQILSMKLEDLTDPEVFAHKQHKLHSSLSKFKMHFQKNLADLTEREQSKGASPKFTVCFMALANYLQIDTTPEVSASAPSMFDVERPPNFSTRRQHILNQDQTQVINEEEEYAEIDDADSGVGVQPLSPETPEKNMQRKPKQSAKHMRMKHSSMPPVANHRRHNVSCDRDLEESCGSVGYSDISMQYNLNFAQGEQRSVPPHNRSSHFVPHGSAVGSRFSRDDQEQSLNQPSQSSHGGGGSVAACVFKQDEHLSDDKRADTPPK